MATRVKGYNILFKVSTTEGGTPRIFGGTTENTFDLTPKLKDSVTKEDEGVVNKSQTGYEYKFGAKGLMEVNESGDEATRIDSHDMIEMVRNESVVDFVYGNPASGARVYKGQARLESYKESTNSEDEGAWDVAFIGVSALTPETNA